MILESRPSFIQRKLKMQKQFQTIEQIADRYMSITNRCIQLKNQFYYSNKILQSTQVQKEMSSVAQRAKPEINGDHLARAIKLSPCYLTFYIVQILMAATLCCFLFFERIQLVVFVEVPIAFFVLLDIVLSHFVEARKKFCSKIQIVNMLVLLGSVTTIVLDLAIPHITKNKIFTVYQMIQTLRYIIQAVWILKLVHESRKILFSYKQTVIVFENNFQIEDQITKMTL